MKRISVVFVCCAWLLASCGRDPATRPGTVRQPSLAYSGLLAVSVIKPDDPAALSKTAIMDHARLQIIVNRQDSTIDTSFTLSTSTIGSKYVRYVPVGRDVEVIANIYSEDDSLTHTGSTLVNVLAADTTYCTVVTKARFGYIRVLIYEVPSNVDSGYVKVSGANMATVYAPLFIDSIARDTVKEYDGHASGVIEYIGIGSNRRVDIYLLKENGQTAYSGTMYTAIKADSNSLGTIALDPGSAKIRVSVVEPDFDTTGVIGSILEDGKPETGEIVFSEIMYNSDGTDHNEWIELYNTTALAVDLSAYTLTVDGDTLAATGIVPGHGYYVIGYTDSSYIDIKIPVFSLPASGETVYALFPAGSDTASDKVRVRYAVSEGWPTSSDGVAIALDKEYLTAMYNNYGSFWHKATDTIPGIAVELGTPGR